MDRNTCCQCAQPKGPWIRIIMIKGKGKEEKKREIKRPKGGWFSLYKAQASVIVISMRAQPSEVTKNSMLDDSEWMTWLPY